MYSIRLNKDLEQKIDAIAKRRETTRSSVIREALEEYVVSQRQTLSPYDLGKQFFGKSGSGENNLSETYKDRLKEKLREKHTH